MTQKRLWELGLDTIRELEVDTGILASGRNEIYGCIFGRDSLITCLKLLNVYKRTRNEYFLSIVKKTLTNLLLLQGKTVNIESGEEPGKCIHEFRPTGHEHLTKRAVKPWYVYPDGIMRNYDTVDATPLLLITLYRYLQASEDKDFIEQAKPNIMAALNWLYTYGDSNGDGFVDYQEPPGRTSGGSTGHGWMDSFNSIFHEDGTPAVEPIAPVEVQAYTYLAYRLWAEYFPERKDELNARASKLKERFNEVYVIERDGFFLASAVDGNGKRIEAVRSSMGHVLWASMNPLYDLEKDFVIKDEHIPKLVHRLLQPDLFHPDAGVRTLSTESIMFTPNSYHNGSFWPHDNHIVAEGLAYAGYIEEAHKVIKAFLTAVAQFETPIELYVYDNNAYSEWTSETGQTSNKKQAWSAAAILAATAFLELDKT